MRRNTKTMLVLLFVKYISDRYAGQPYAPIRIREARALPIWSHSKAILRSVTSSTKIFSGRSPRITPCRTCPTSTIQPSSATAKKKVARLTNLIAIFENPALDFSKNRADGDDLLGDACEYLMRHFATESGKSKGQFYTPAEVSRVIAQLLGIRHANPTNDTSVYDPTCGLASCC